MWDGSCILRYGDDIYNAATGKVPPEQVCSAIDLCSSAAVADSTVAVGAATKCELCELALSVTADLIPKDYTEAEFVTLVYSICSLIPGNLGAECAEGVQSYGTDIYIALTGMIPPDQVCHEIEACENTTAVAAASSVPTAGLECLLCEWIFQESAAEFPANMTVAEFDAELDRACLLLQGLEQECENLVIEYGPSFYDALSGKANPEEICQAAHLCN